MTQTAEMGRGWPGVSARSAWESLVLRSRLLGADPRVTNFGGGNTSAKVDDADPLTGESVRVLWVKGSGGDLGTIEREGFATLDLARVLALEGRYRGREHEDELVPLLPHCVFGLNPRAPSIDTPLHAFVPFAHVDHVHPDAVIALAAARNGERLTRDVYGDEVGWLPWQRPGFDLGLRMRDALRERPELKGIVMGGHWLIAWADDAQGCYENTLALIARAEAWLAAHARGPVFGGVALAPRAASERRAIAAELMPLLRGRLSTDGAKVGHFTDARDVLEFTGSKRLEELAALGTSCPDHFLRTRVRPLVLPADPVAAERELDERLVAYREDYAAYYDRCRDATSPPMRGADPVVYLVPGVGMITFASDKAMTRIAAEFYRSAIRVMRGASSVDEYVGLPEREAFGIEYWSLEQAKLDRLPPQEPMRGRIALITGGAGGIGAATADRMLADGACVVLVDCDAEPLEARSSELRARFGDDPVRTVVADVSDEGAVAAAFEACAREYGGVDVVVSNAGIASGAPIGETSLADWHRIVDVLATGSFLVGRAAMRMLERQGTGGSIVFIGSKNGLVASPNASAYSSAKAATMHLARCLALEGASIGVRVNTVNPDAVLTGSRIWQGEWRAERARAYGIAPEDLEEHYRRRSLLQRSVRPSDVAEAVHFFATERSSRSTGNALNVDGGNAAAFPR